MKTPAIIIDLDGTLCNTAHRQHFMQAKPKDWVAFYGALEQDAPNIWCAEIYRRFLEDHVVFFVSGRPDNHRAQTLAWMKKHGFSHRTNILLMRKEGDFRPDHVVKTEIYRNEIEPENEVLFCIDDRQQVVDAWRALGLTCLQCAKGDF